MRLRARHTHRLKIGAARFAPPLLVLILGSLTLTAAWVALCVWLASRAGSLPEPYQAAETKHAAFGPNWTSMAVRYWWGESASLETGWRGARMVDASGKEVFSPAPDMTDGESLLDLVSTPGPRVRLSQQATGWPLRVWSVVHYRPWDDEHAAWQTRKRVLWWPAVVSGLSFAASGALLAAALYGALVLIRSRLRLHRGCCPWCAYVRTGLAEGAPCPECGWESRR
jgi:hypothetical protein